MRITLCGSTRFEPLFHEWNLKLGLAGHTVYNLTAFGREVHESHKSNELVLTDEQKVTLDLVHLDKILNSEAIVVINPSNYVGFSTSREIQWARLQGKRIYWLENDHDWEAPTVWDLVASVPMPMPAPPPAPPLAPPPTRVRSLDQLDDDIPF